MVIDPDDGPRGLLPELPASLGASARLALDRVLGDGSEMATGWVDSAESDQRRQEVRQALPGGGQALPPPGDAAGAAGADSSAQRLGALRGVRAEHPLVGAGVVVGAWLSASGH